MTSIEFVALGMLAVLGPSLIALGYFLWRATAIEAVDEVGSSRDSVQTEVQFFGDAPSLDVVETGAAPPTRRQDQISLQRDPGVDKPAPGPAEKNERNET
jgi:hypothetical protein